MWFTLDSPLTVHAQYEMNYILLIQAWGTNESFTWNQRNVTNAINNIYKTVTSVEQEHIYKLCKYSRNVYISKYALTNINDCQAKTDAGTRKQDSAAVGLLQGGQQVPGARTPHVYLLTSTPMIYNVVDHLSQEYV